MRRAWRLQCIFCVALSCLPTLTFAQQSGIPLWEYSVVGPSNHSSTIGQSKTYKGSIVGQNPFSGERGTTVVTIMLIPVRVTFPARPPGNGSIYPTPEVVFDPTAISCVAGRTPLDIAQSSPLFNNADYVVNGVNVGDTQYVDAVQRANFWQAIQGTPYQVLFQLKTLSLIDVTVPPDQGDAYWSGCFQDHAINGGMIRESWFDNYVRTTLLPSLAAQGVGPGVLPVFYLDTAAFKLDDPRYAASAVYSYHSWMPTPNGPQFYAVATFNAGGYTPPTYGIPAPDQPLTDELVNWVNNPFASNETPAWGWIGERLGCYSSYAPTWPLTLTSTYPLSLNGYTYTLTEQTFFSWFYEQSPSIAAGSLYSDRGTLTKPASAQGCTFAN